MSLHYHHHHHHHAEKAGTKNVATAFFINLVFTILEIIGGIFTNSIAILSDALHDFGDTLALGMAWYFEKLSTKKANNQFTYGYGRFTVLGALINATILVTGSIFIVYNAIPRLLSPEVVNAKGMFVMAILGVIFNGAAIFKLNKKGSLNERVVYYHLLEDVLGWVVVLISSVFIYFFEIYWLDVILSMLIAVYISYNAVRNLVAAVRLILQKVPDGINLDQIKSKLEQIEHVLDVHDLHGWSMDGNFTVMSMHCKLNSNEISLPDLKNIKVQILKELESFDVKHATVEFESPDEAICDLNETE